MFMPEDSKTLAYKIVADVHVALYIALERNRTCTPQASSANDAWLENTLATETFSTDSDEVTV